MHATTSHTTAPLTHPQEHAEPAQAPHVAPVDAGTARTFSITSFILGIASVVSGWTFFVPIAGLVFGILALRRQTAERTLALWGVWLNAAMLALSALLVLAVLAAIAFGLFTLPFVV